MPMRLVPLGHIGDDFQRTVLHTLQGVQALRRTRQLVRTPAHHHDLEAAVVIEVNVQRRSHVLTEIVLELGELLREITDMVVINEGEHGHDLDRAFDACSQNCPARQVSKRFGAGTAAALDDLVEFRQQRRLHRYAKPDESFDHRGEGNKPFAAVGRKSQIGQPAAQPPLATQCPSPRKWPTVVVRARTKAPRSSTWLALPVP